MTTAERLRRLEDELEYVKAIIDGSEAQTREAVICVSGLLMAYLKKKGALDYDELIRFLADSADPDRESEDHNGQLIHDMRRVIIFHRDLEAGTLEPHVPVEELLSPEEIASVLARAKAKVAFDEPPTDGRKKKIRKQKGSQPGNEPPLH